MRKLYGHPLSGNCHKVRLLLSALELEYEDIVVDVIAGEQKKPDFLAMNPRGQVPVLVEDELTLYDSQAILVYLARKYGGEDWLPSDPAEMAKITQWLSFAANEIHHGPNMARLNFLLGLNLDNIATIQANAKTALQIIDTHLSGREWLESSRVTIADLACFPYVALAGEGKVSLDEYKNVGAWIARIKALPKYISMPGL